jgi:hypothetical protein
VEQTELGTVVTLLTRSDTCTALLFSALRMPSQGDNPKQFLTLVRDFRTISEGAR